MSAVRQVSAVRQAWKAVVAFFAPGLTLIAERVLTDEDVGAGTMRRALLAGLATSVLVYFTRNGASGDPDTSTPSPGLPGNAA